MEIFSKRLLQEAFPLMPVFRPPLISSPFPNRLALPHIHGHAHLATAILWFSLLLAIVVAAAVVITMAQLSSDSETSDLLAALSVDDSIQKQKLRGADEEEEEFDDPEEDEDSDSDDSSDAGIALGRSAGGIQGRSTPSRGGGNGGRRLPAETDDDEEDEQDSDSYFGDSDDEKMDGGHHGQQASANHHHGNHHNLHNVDHRFAAHNSNYYKPLLPPQKEEHKGRLCVVLDMDETLIHSVFESAENNYRQDEERASTRHKHHFTVVVGTDDEVETAHVYKRPGLMRFVEELAKHCEVVVFTAALPVYAKPVLDKIDPNGYIIHRLYRDATVTYRGQPFVKDLARLGRDMRKCVLVDNNPFALLATPDNAMPIQSFYDDPEDNELEKALQLLLEMSQLDDVRPYLQERFNFRAHLHEILRMNEF